MDKKIPFGFPISEDEYMELEKNGATITKNTNFFVSTAHIPVGMCVNVTSIESKQTLYAEITNISHGCSKNKLGNFCYQVNVKKVDADSIEDHSRVIVNIPEKKLADSYYSRDQVK